MVTSSSEELLMLIFLSILLTCCSQTQDSVLQIDDSFKEEEQLLSPDSRRMRPFNLIAPRVASTTAGGILNDVESEPGLVWPAVTTLATSTTTPSPPVEEGGSSLLAGSRLMAHMQRLTERLSSIEGLQVQTLRKLEGLDYRLTRVEVQMQERGETIRSMATDTSRRMQQLEGDVGRIETLLEVVRDELTAIRASQSEIKLLVTQQSGPTQALGRGGDSELPGPRLQVLLAGMNNLRSTVSGLKEDMAKINRNVTVLLNLTRSVELSNAKMATKQDLYKGLASLNGHDSAPARTLSHFSTPPSCSSSERPIIPRDCSEALSLGNRQQSGIFQIKPQLSSVEFFVNCDMETRGGGWTILQNRLDGAVNFLRDWTDYKNGFGNLATEFWLGLEKIHMITNQGVYELLIEVMDFGLNQAFAHYTAFAIGSEIEGYDIRLLGSYDGDAGDSLSYHTSMKFSTPDNDQDQWPDGNCARDHTGGWWYKSCDTSNLNGQYLNGPVPQEFEYKGMYWYDYQGPMYSLMRSRMMIRPLVGNVMGSFNGTTFKPRAAQVPQPPQGGQQSRTTSMSPKGAAQITPRPKKRKEDKREEE